MPVNINNFDVSWWSNFSSVPVLGNLKHIIQLAQSHRKRFCEKQTRISWISALHLVLKIIPSFWRRYLSAQGYPQPLLSSQNIQKPRDTAWPVKGKILRVSAPNRLLLLQLLFNENGVIWLLSKAKKGVPGWKDPRGELWDGEHHQKSVYTDWHISSYDM